MGEGGRRGDQETACSSPTLLVSPSPRLAQHLNKIDNRTGERGVPVILLVDDEEMNRDFLQRRLQKRGYEVSTAVDGADACARTAETHPDLILMDVMMPNMDGLEATRKLRAAPGTQHIPVIALTARAMTGDREQVLAAGCDDYATKPIDLPELLVKIEALLANRRQV